MSVVVSQKCRGHRGTAARGTCGSPGISPADNAVIHTSARICVLTLKGGSSTSHSMRLANPIRVRCVLTGKCQANHKCRERLFLCGLCTSGKPQLTFSAGYLRENVAPEISARVELNLAAIKVTISEKCCKLEDQ